MNIFLFKFFYQYNFENTHTIQLWYIENKKSHSTVVCFLALNRLIVFFFNREKTISAFVGKFWLLILCIFSRKEFNRNMKDNKYARAILSGVVHRWADFAKVTLRSRSYKHLQHQVTGLASVFLNLQSSHAYGGVVSDPIEGAPYIERPLLVLRNAAGA